MKWEILKGSEKDFEGSPESATVRIFEKGFEEHISIFADKFETGSIRTHADTGVYNSYIQDVSNWSVIAQRRPITEPDVNQQVTNEWSGEGLPPVGVECEMLWDKEWVKCVIKAYGDEQFIFKAQGHREWAGHINNFEFRPIRSPEDVARDAAIEAMRDVGYALPAATRFTKEEMAAMYDAGYRKVE